MSNGQNGFLYAVIFGQGTVKVGMTMRAVERRFRSHSLEGMKWGVESVKFLSMEVLTGDVGFREIVMCGHMQKVSRLTGGYEWFKFETADAAETSVAAIFKKVAENDFSEIQYRYYHDDKRNEMSFSAAMTLIKSGSSPGEAAAKVGLPLIAILNKREYREWSMSNIEKKVAK